MFNSGVHVRKNPDSFAICHFTLARLFPGMLGVFH